MIKEFNIFGASETSSYMVAQGKTKCPGDKDILYLASQSSSRKFLLEQAGINFKILGHKSDEMGINPNQDFKNYVLDISRHKMELVDLSSLSNFNNGDKIFVLTADTLVQALNSKEILGKPKDIQDAKYMLSLWRSQKGLVITACCLHLKIFINNHWIIDKIKEFAVSSLVDFYVPEEFEDIYIQKTNALMAASAGVIDGFGQNFLKSVSGSYTNIIGLPLFELRENLKKLGFKF